MNNFWCAIHLEKIKKLTTFTQRNNYLMEMCHILGTTNKVDLYVFKVLTKLCIDMSDVSEKLEDAYGQFGLFIASADTALKQCDNELMIKDIFKFIPITSSINGASPTVANSHSIIRDANGIQKFYSIVTYDREPKGGNYVRVCGIRCALLRS